MTASFFSSAEKLRFRRKWIGSILTLQFASVLFEGIGIGLFLPILELITSGKTVQSLASESALWQHLVDAFRFVGVEPTLGPLLTAALIAFLLRQAFLAGKMLVLNSVKFTFMRDVRRQAFDGFLSASLRFHDKVSAGEFANELTTELNAATGALIAYINFVGQMIVCTVYMVGLFVLSPEMTAATMAIFGATAVLLSGLMRKSRTAGKLVLAANQSLSKFLLERIRSIRLIRLSATEEAERASIVGLTDAQCNQLIHLNKISTLLAVSVEPIILLGGFVVFYISIEQLDVQPERVMLLFVAILRLLPVIKEALVRRQAFLSGVASVDTIHDRLNEMAHEPEIMTPGDTFAPPTREIRLENVSFSYTGATGRSVLDGLDAAIPARKLTAIVGPSGSGKSTLIDLLPRLRTPITGSVLIDSKDISAFDLRTLRDGIAFVSQFPTVFDMTPAEYIAYGADALSRDDIRQAAETAQAAEFIDQLPDGYDTRLGEAGSTLSGGQRQRLDLARALARKASIIILDEPTSNLDAGSERAIVAALQQIRAKELATIIIVAHRPSAALVADHILVMQNGRITAEGAHESLLAADGWYRDTLFAPHS